MELYRESHAIQLQFLKAVINYLLGESHLYV